MSFGYTYDDLVEAVKREVGEAVPSLAIVPQWIRFAEVWCERFLDADCFKAVATGTVGAGVGYIEVPSDYNDFGSLWLTDGYGEPFLVDLVAPDKVHLVGTSRAGVPVACARLEDQFVLRPINDAAYDYVLHYRKKLEPLSPSNPTNALLEDHFDVLFYRTLLYSSPYLYEDKRLVVWQAILKDLVNGLELNQWRKDNRPKFRSTRTELR